jgi:hypothetical protein
MTDEELTQAFPYGATMIPRREEAPSSTVVIGDDYPAEEGSTTFNVWMNSYHQIELSRELTPWNDGYVAKSTAGEEYFLRPLDEAHKAGV